MEEITTLVSTTFYMELITSRPWVQASEGHANSCYPNTQSQMEIGYLGPTDHCLTLMQHVRIYLYFSIAKYGSPFFLLDPITVDVIRVNKWAPLISTSNNYIS
jgi:hypothetical protein